MAQIEQIERGKIFTFKDLAFDREKTANVAVLLSELSRKGEIVRVEKGAYYRPAQSVLGLGDVPVYQDEKLRYLTEKLNGYISGIYAYNKMLLTEQVPSVIFIATPTPVRRFEFQNTRIVCMKCYCSDFDEDTIPYLRVLDALRNISHIPGTTGQVVYDRVKKYHFKEYSKDDIAKIVELAKNYPPRVRAVVADILIDLGKKKFSKEIAATIHPTTRIKKNYSRKKLQMRRGEVLKSVVEAAK